MKKILLSICSLGLMAAYGCGSTSETPQNSEAATMATTEDTAAKVRVPDFNADSAYSYIAQQVAMGPRTPGSAAQTKCADWMETQLKRYCDTVYRQEAQVIAGDKKTKLRCINIIGAIRPQAKRRILLLAHWDSRPWADRDVANKDKPILAADDGGSGVAVLISLAQAVKSLPLNNPDIGVDLLMTDVEDYGKSEWGDDSYALGTQYWAKHPHIPGYRAEGGILLDMVGGRNARFPLEGNSRQYAASLQRDVWAAANRAGYSSFFVYDDGGTITDDHVPVIETMKIPTIDIIHLPAGSPTGFPDHWHTHNDNMSVIDRGTLKAVGQTLLQFLYEQ